MIVIYDALISLKKKEGKCSDFFLPCGDVVGVHQPRF
jgi:hypothetical protein